MKIHKWFLGAVVLTSLASIRTEAALNQEPVEEEKIRKAISLFIGDARPMDIPEGCPNLSVNLLMSSPTVGEIKVSRYSTFIDTRYVFSPDAFTSYGKIWSTSVVSHVLKIYSNQHSSFILEREHFLTQNINDPSRFSVKNSMRFYKDESGEFDYVVEIRDHNYKPLLCKYKVNKKESNASVKRGSRAQSTHEEDQDLAAASAN